MAKRASPSVGHNGGPVDQAAVRSALATMVLYKAEQKALNEKVKRLRKGFEGKGIPLAEIDELYGHKDDTPGEIVEMFKRRASVFGAFFSDLNEQFDIFAPKADASEVRASYKHAGLMQALKGEKFAPPPGLAGDNLQQMLDGHNEGWPLYEASKTEFLAQAIANAQAGIVTDGTGGPKTAAQKVGEQAAKDFAEDNGDPLTVAGVTYPNLTAADQARQKLKEKGEGDGVKTAEDFEASPEELGAQTQRKVLEEQRAANEPDTMDEAALAAAEAKLKASGFAEQKPKRRSAK